MKPKMQNVLLVDIVPSKTNPRAEEDFNKSISNESLHDLMNSIVERGILQPIVVRPNGKKGKSPGDLQYELVCGERRYQACKMIGMAEIPATIMEMTDEEALDAQITENLQRKDVHPLDEAIAFKALMKMDPKVTFTDLGLRFGKHENFIAQRLSLNNLLPKFKKMFYADEIQIGQALLLCRMPHEAQNRLDDEGISVEVPVKELKDDIDRSIMHNLSSVRFKKDDAALIPKAGACTVCPKRTGASPSLFPDIKKGDLCLDGDCFDAKIAAFLVQKVKTILEESPEILLVRGYGTPADAIEKMAKEMKVKILTEYNHYNECSGKEKGLKAFVLSGSQAGHYIQIKLKGGTKVKTEKGDTGEVAQAKIQIAGIKERAKRAKELDQEKVYAKILNDFHKLTPKGYTTPMNGADETAMWYLLIDKAGYGGTEEICKRLGIKGWDDENKFDEINKRLTGLGPAEKAFIIRISFHHNYGGNYPTAFYAMLLRQMADQHRSIIPISKYEKEQDEIAKDREARVAERIKELQTKGGKG